MERKEYTAYRSFRPSHDFSFFRGGRGYNPSRNSDSKIFRRPTYSNEYFTSLDTEMEHRKFRYHDEKGRQITAGGLLPYDDEGIWVIGEIKKGGKKEIVEWTDMGGKYRYEDCDIYTTIAREFSEELYFSSELRRSDVERLNEMYSEIYVNGHLNRPVYVCLAVHTSDLKDLRVEMNREEFLKRRELAMICNPHVPAEYYSSFDLRHISFSEVCSSLKEEPDSYPLSYRLKRVLRNDLRTFRKKALSIETPEKLESTREFLEVFEVSSLSLNETVRETSVSEESTKENLSHSPLKEVE